MDKSTLVKIGHMVDIKPYESGKHEEYLPDVHKPYYTSPEDIELFRSVSQEAVEELKSVSGFSADFEVVVAGTDEEEMSEDVPDSYYFHGFSFDDGMRGHEGYAVFIRATTVFDWWKDSFKDMLIHEIGHQIFYQRENQDNWEDSQYFSIMFEGFSENLANKVNQEFGYGWRPEWRKDKPVNLDIEELFRDLKKPRGFGDEDDSKDHDMFLNGGERWSNAEGYTISYQIVRNILEEEDIDLEEIINIESDRWENLVESAVERLY